MQNKTVCIIPARGGSKRIPRKNIKPFCGKPIIAYSIEAAIESGLFDEVMVSTDDTEIAEIAQHYGASVPFIRSEKNANDYATTIDVIDEVLDAYEAIGQHFDLACCIYATAPFVSPALLNTAHKKLISEALDCVFPAVEYSYPVQRALIQNKEGKITMREPKYQLTRSQDLEKIYHDVGIFYFTKTKAIAIKRQLWTDNTSIIELKETETQDIDTLEDWAIAEMKFKLLNDPKT